AVHNRFSPTRSIRRPLRPARLVFPASSRQTLPSFSALPSSAPSLRLQRRTSPFPVAYIPRPARGLRAACLRCASIPLAWSLPSATLRDLTPSIRMLAEPTMFAWRGVCQHHLGCECCE
ncbi:hypothetical protein BDN70DRAFT_888697, partial [Pholiota conissans]